MQLFGDLFFIQNQPQSSQKRPFRFPLWIHIVMYVASSKLATHCK